MTIRWKRITPKIVEGWVNDIHCFELCVVEDKITLTCELPSVHPSEYGRHVELHKTAAAATKAAELILESWTERFLA